MNRGEFSDLVFGSTLSGPQRLALLAHVSHFDSARPVEQGRAWPGPSRMAALCGCSLSGAKKVRRELKALGILVEAGFEGPAKAYRVNPAAIPCRSPAQAPEAAPVEAPAPTLEEAQGGHEVTGSRGDRVTSSPGHEVTGSRGDREGGHEVTGGGHEVTGGGSRGDHEPSSRTLLKNPLQEPSTGEGGEPPPALPELPPLGRGVRRRDLTRPIAAVLGAWFGPDPAAWSGRKVRADLVKAVRAALRECSEGDLLAVVEFHRTAEHRDAAWARERGLDLPNLINSRVRHRNVERALRWRRGQLKAPAPGRVSGGAGKPRDYLDQFVGELDFDQLNVDLGHRAQDEGPATGAGARSNVIQLGAR